MRRSFLLGAACLLSLAAAGGVEPMDMQRSTMPRGAGTAAMQSQMGQMLTALRPLRGHTFDIKWTQLMIDHHQMAVEMAQHELMRGADPRVQAQAQKVVTAQQREIATMQGWLRAWTGQSYAPQPMPMGMKMHGSMDKWFLEGMIPHHQGAIDMSKLIPERTQNVQLRQMGQNIIRAQTAEILQYRQLLKSLP